MRLVLALPGRCATAVHCAAYEIAGFVRARDKNASIVYGDQAALRAAMRRTRPPDVLVYPYVFTSELGVYANRLVIENHADAFQRGRANEQLAREIRACAWTPKLLFVHPTAESRFARSHDVNILHEHVNQVYPAGADIAVRRAEIDYYVDANT